MFSLGQIVISKAGRDKGAPLIVVGGDGEYAYLADGRGRPVSRPKKKKVKHVQVTHYIDTELAEKIRRNEHIADADFRKALERYLSS